MRDMCFQYARRASTQQALKKRESPRTNRRNDKVARRDGQLGRIGKLCGREVPQSFRRRIG